MNQLFEFVTHHPLLAGGIAALAAAALAVEVRHRQGAAASVGPLVAVQLMNRGALVLDVRSADDFAAGHIIDARHVPQAELGGQADSLKKYREKPVLVCCETGASAGAAAGVLKALGFTQVFNLRGGLSAWKQENLPLVAGTAAKSGKASAKK